MRLPDKISESREKIMVEAEKTKNNNGQLTNQEIEQWFGTIENEDYVNNKITLAKRAKSLFIFWNEFSMTANRIKEGYRLAKKWGDDGLSQKYIEEGKPIVQKLISIEDDLKEILPQLKNITFLQENELFLMPKWMLDLLDIKITKN